IGWHYEGIAWNAPSSGAPVYRLYNSNAGDHHYTLAIEEKNNLVQAGWHYEGISWYSGGTTPILRLYNPNAIAGAHHYTLSEPEYNHLVTIGWKGENIGWYGEPSSSPNNDITIVDGKTYVNGILIVNKKHPLPANYNPGEDPTAKKFFMLLVSDMRRQGYSISDYYSGFRSYETQESLYRSYVNSHGQQAADRFSARPGYSEHQSGLAFDLVNGQGQLLGENGDSEAVNWLSQHAHEYGFIVRYLPGKEAITGYMAEPWHIRYVGDIAARIYQSGLTLEEYLSVSGGDYQ
uniref:D-alanyl-D-alanine carboxypeptidase family protein n=1 Tax=Streptococcus merionis TaxID=400065 RepID=UPI0026EF6DE0